MTRALDGTYWRFKRQNGCVSEMKAPTKWQILVWHNPELGKPVRIRPRMSITKAVALLTEARKQGVELWMRRATDGSFWHGLKNGDLIAQYLEFTVAITGHRAGISHDGILARWIVATPEDARKIDAKRGGK